MHSWALLVAGLKAEANLAQAEVASWAAGCGKSTNKGYIQQLK